ncbi:MAG: Holliday junction resolvase RuvX [Clostridia bacterium]|nr:Holliday junction resolvase RuvX [Clostridia bacterium]
MRILGIDYGDARVGLAVSDPFGWTASELPQIKGGDLGRAGNEIAAICKERGVEKIVLGYPKNMNGTIGPRGEISEKFKEILEKKTGLSVELWDERLTTVSATNIMNTSGFKSSKRKDRRDSLSAAIILESYLKSLD